jgi:GNAT superfamily N-acetyltransferase
MTAAETPVLRVRPIESVADLKRVHPLFAELRPHLDEATFVAQVQRQRSQSGYTLVAGEVVGGRLVTGAGYRVVEHLAWRKAVYLDDLVTAASDHRHGYGGQLLDWVIAEARRLGCGQFHLDSGTQRHAAHRLYLSRHLRISAFHFSTELT